MHGKLWYRIKMVSHQYPAHNVESIVKCVRCSFEGVALTSKRVSGYFRDTSNTLMRFIAFICHCLI